MENPCGPCPVRVCEVLQMRKQACHDLSSDTGAGTTGSFVSMEENQSLRARLLRATVEHVLKNKLVALASILGR